MIERDERREEKEYSEQGKSRSTIATQHARPTRAQDGSKKGAKQQEREMNGSERV